MERNLKHNQMPNKYSADKENKYSEVPECFKPSLTRLFAAEKMRRQKEYANTIREQNKKINKMPITPNKEPEDKDKQVPRMKVAQIAGKEREQETSSSLSRLSEQLHVSEMTVEVRDSRTSRCPTSSQPLVPTVTNRYLPQQDTQLPPCCLQGLESSPTERSTPITDSLKVLSPMEEPPRREDDEWSPSAAADGYLVWMKKKQQSVIQSAITAEKMRKKRENAKAKNKSKKRNKIPITPSKEPEDKDKQVPRMKVAQIAGKEREQETSSSPSRLSEQLHVPEMTVEVRDSRTSRCPTSSQPLVPMVTNRYLPQQDNQLPPCCLQGLESRPAERSTTIPDPFKVLRPMEEPPRREDDERRANQHPQMEKKQQSNTHVCQEGRVQKKKMKRMAFTATKKAKDKDAPRMKMLEFVKTLGKPMEGLEISQLSRLDFLIQQHKEDKRVIALLFK